MKLAPRMVAAAALAAALIIPATAGAKSSVSVQGHVVKAHNALAVAKRHTAAHHYSAAKRAVRVARHETSAASRAARRLRGDAGNKAAAYGYVAVQYNEDLTAFTQLLGQSGGSLQALLAQALQPALSGRQQALGSLQGLLGSLPTGMLPDFTKLISGLIAGSAGQATTLAGLLSGGLPGGLQHIIEQALATATGIATAGLAQVEQLLTMLPPEEQAAIKAVLDQIIADLGHLSEVLGGILGTPTTPGTPTPPACPTTGTPPATGGLGGLLGAPLAMIGQLQGFIQQILGLVLGGPGGGTPACGTTPAPGGFLPFPSFLKGLLGGLGLGGLGLGGIGLGFL